MAAAPDPGDGSVFFGGGLEVLDAAGEGLDDLPDLLEPTEENAEEAPGVQRSGAH